MGENEDFREWSARVGEVVKVLKNRALLHIVKDLSMFGDNRNDAVRRYII